jgi:hypothetical protein
VANLTAADLAFIDDQQYAQGSPVWGTCMQKIGDDEDNQSVYCGDDCSPNEQICHSCKGVRFF